MPDYSALQIPEADRGELHYSVSVDRSRVTRQSGGYAKTVVIGVVGTVIGALLAILLDMPAGWVVVAIFGFILVLGLLRLWTAKQLVAAPDEELVAFQVRAGGLLVPYNFFIPWSEIDRITYEWREAGGGTAVGVAGYVAKRAYDKSMSKHDLDNARRVMTVMLNDYTKTKSRVGGVHVGTVVGPMFGLPATAAVDLSGTVDDEQFKEALAVTERVARANGKGFEIHDIDAENAAAKAAQQAARAAKRAGR
jgi:MFS family permease